MTYRKARLTAGQKTAIALAALTFLGLVGWIYGGSYLRQRDLALDRAAGAAVAGPPCEPLTAAAFAARKLSAPKATRYEGVTFARRFGHVECSALRYGGGWGSDTYPVCQFTSPAALRVKTAQGEWFFAPPPGQPATVAVPHGQPRCLLGSNFRLPG